LHLAEDLTRMTLPDVREPGNPPLIERLTARVAALGGALALAIAGLVVVSVLGRWLFSSPVEGDFEFVKMATAIAVFAYLPYTQARRGNIMVDTFTSRLSARHRPGSMRAGIWPMPLSWGCAAGASSAARATPSAPAKPPCSSSLPSGQPSRCARPCACC
jgi:hypothetical protein